MCSGRVVDLVDPTKWRFGARKVAIKGGGPCVFCSDDEGSESLATAEILIDYFKFSHPWSEYVGRGVLM